MRNQLFVCAAALFTALVAVACGTTRDVDRSFELCSTDADCSMGRCVGGLCRAELDGTDDLDPADSGDGGDSSDVTLCGGAPCVASCCDGLCCEQAQQCCGGVCTDTRFDAGNCGACGATCGTNQVCVGGACVCRPGYSECDGDQATSCETNLLADVEHCGQCGSSCGDLACYDGHCMCGDAFCAAQETCCDLCVDLELSAAHCGACDLACGYGERCVQGACACNGGPPCAGSEICCSEGCVIAEGCSCGSAICQPPEACCGETCVDVASDASNCGACGKNCGAASCVNGDCVCPTGTACLIDGSTVCVDVLDDEQNCGGCGIPCGAGELCCDGACVGVATDPTHCGACDLTCTGACVEGRCDCGGTSAADLSIDEDNCGACANTCDDHPHTNNGATFCVGGRCEYVCDGDFRDCDSSAPGCETDTGGDASNCGQCGARCPVGATCVAGLCNCDGNGDLCVAGVNGVATATCTGESCTLTCATGFADCDGIPDNGCETSLAEDEDNCGACGVVCDDHTHTENGPTTCVDGACDYVCDNLDWADCESGPGSEGCETDVRYTLEHCGGCGQLCPDGSPCTAGACKCGGDGDACHPWSANVSAASCSGKTCQLECQVPYADCDGDPTNGCESDAPCP